MGNGEGISLVEKKKRFTALKQYQGIIIVLAVMIAAGGILSFETFLTWSNFSNVLRQASIIGIMAVGMTFVIISGGIDLSVGSNMILSSVFAAKFFLAYGSVAMIFIAIAIGTVFGLVNGLFITKFKLPPFILTLGMMSVGAGLTLIYTDAKIVTGYDAFTKTIGAGYIADVLPVPVVIFLIVGIIGLILEKKTIFGRYSYAIGGNEEAAKLSAINVNKFKILYYTFCGFLCGIAAIVMFCRMGSASAEIGQGSEMDVIAAVVIGGTAMSGGVGSVGGSMIGVVILQLATNILNMLGVPSYAQQAFKGAIIIAAIIIYQQQAKIAEKKNRA